MLRNDIYRARAEVLAKAREEGIIVLTKSEIRRVFAGTVSPSACMRAMRAMMRAGLTVGDVYALRVPMNDYDKGV